MKPTTLRKRWCGTGSGCDPVTLLSVGHEITRSLPLPVPYRMICHRKFTRSLPLPVLYRMTCHRILLVLLLVFALMIGAPVQMRAQEQTSSPKKAPVIPHWKVSVSDDEPVRVTLLAEDAPIEKVIAPIAAKLGVPVSLSPLVKTQMVRAKFTDVSLGDALRALAPQAYVDCFVNGGAASSPKYVGVYLHALNEAPPPVTASVKARSEAILIEGDTEDPESVPTVKAKETDGPKLQVSFDQQLLSLHARRQPLTAVLYEVASRLGAPFEMQYESAETIDLDWSGQDVTGLWQLLPVHARLYFRADLQRNEKKVLRIVLLKPVKE